ncbi:APC family permease [Pseudonocardia sp.]|uniref:APC family permease n=1 Tax=Pseudonocardia sp. TaxID=60912 RepID=UPI002630EE84|nr:APC family permease [Pseudonocardia sp.]
MQRRLGTADAVVLGLAAMVGTGVFAVWGPAAAAAGPWLLLSVVLAGVVAACNAASTADLAVAHPESGGGYVYARERVSPAAGRLAGVAFLVGKSASAAAAAGVFGSYVLPSAPLPAAILAVVVSTALNTAGVRWTSRGAYALVGGTLVVLLLVVVVGLSGSGGGDAVAAAAQTAPVPVQGGPLGVLTAAGLVFFAFAGYARIATLGEEVRDPRRTLRRAIAVALGIALVVYLLVAVALLVGMGSEHLAGETSPLVALVDSGRAPGLGVLVRVGAAVAAGSALLSVLVGLSRTGLAMARRGELPTCLAVIGPRGTPWRADLVGGLVAVVITVLAGPAAAIALSACSVLVYYAVINVAALRLPATERRWPAWTAVLGLVLCVGLAALLPLTQVLITAAVLLVIWTACTVLPRR